MNRILFFVPVTAALVCCLCAGSGPKFIVKDTSNYDVYFDEMKLDRVDYLSVKQGETLIRIPFKSVKNVTIHPDETIVFERDLYYMAEVELLTGDIVGTENTARDKTYLRASGSVSGRMGKSTIKLNINQITAIQRQ